MKHCVEMSKETDWFFDTNLSIDFRILRIVEFDLRLPDCSPPRLWNTGLVSSGASLTSWGEGVSLALVGHPSSDGVTIKMPYPRDFEILGWCPAGPVLPHGEKVPLQPWLATLLVMVSQ